MLTQAREPFKTFLYIVQLARARAIHKQCETQFTRDWTVRRLEWSARFIIIIIIILRQVFSHIHILTLRIRWPSRLRSHAVIVGVSRVHDCSAVRLLLRRRRPLREVAKNNRRRPFRAADYIPATYIYIYIPSAIIVYRSYVPTTCESPSPALRKVYKYVCVSTW